MYSVVVPTFNRAPTLGMTLESLLGQETTVSYEVVVVDNNSSDGTRAVVEALQDRPAGTLRYVVEREQGSSAARNAGIEAARGDIIVFVDDDVIAQPDWLQVLADTYRAYPDAWAVGGKVTLRLPADGPPWFDLESGILAAYLSRQDFGDGTVKIEYPHPLISANLSVSRAALSSAGAFDTTLGRFGDELLCGEDTELCTRIQHAGGTVYYSGRAVVTHVIPRSRMTKRFFRSRAYWEGRTVALLADRDDSRSPGRRLRTDGPVIAKDWLIALVRYGMGDSRRAFEHELAARKQLGRLQHLFRPRGLGYVAARWRALVPRRRAERDGGT
jgi:glycosyltransferase involved in cell wall biosynthesis